MRRRRPLGRSNSTTPVTRQEFEELRAEILRIGSQRPPYISLVESISDDPDVDDSYGWRFGGTAEGAEVVETDGLAPAAVEFAPVVEGGVSFLAIKWRAVDNPDVTTYEVHLSDTSGFTPNPTTLRAETLGTLVFLRQQPANVIVNPSVEGDLTGWESKAGATVTQSTEQAIQETNSIKVDCPGADASEGVQATFSESGIIAALGGRRYTFSAYIYSTSARDFALKWNEYDAASVYLTTRSATVSHTGTGWERFSLSADTDAACTQIQPSVESGLASAVIFYVDGLMFEYEPDLSDYTENNDPVLVRGDTYYVKIVAKDDDGSATASPEGVGQLAQVTGPDIAADAVIAEHILAGSITAEHLEAMMVLVTTLMAGAEGSSRVEVGVTEMEDGVQMVGIHGFDTDGETVTFMFDAATGQVYLKGTLDFGVRSRLLSNDIIELGEQPLGFESVHRVQSRSKANTAAGTWSGFTLLFTAPTTLGNLAIAIVSMKNTTLPSTPATPVGWTKVAEDTEGTTRLVVFARENCPSITGLTVNFDGATKPQQVVMSLIEVSGIAAASALDFAVTATGSSGQPTVSKGSAIAQADEYLLAIAVVSDDGGDDVPGVTLNALDTTNGGWGAVMLQGNTPTTLGRYDLSQYGVDQLTGSAISPVYTSNGSTSSLDEGWIVAMLGFKAAAADVVAPDTTKLRLYGKYASVPDATALHAQGEDGIENSVVLGPADQRWRFEHLSVAVNFGSVPAHTGGTGSCLAPVVTGDLVVFLGHPDPGNRALVIRVEPVVLTNGQIDFWVFNADSSPVDIPSLLFHFLIIHTS